MFLNHLGPWLIFCSTSFLRPPGFIELNYSRILTMHWHILLHYKASPVRSSRVYSIGLISKLLSSLNQTIGHVTLTAVTMATILLPNLLSLYPGSRLNIKMESYRYRDSPHKDKTALRQSYLYNGNPYTCQTRYLYWGGPLADSQVNSFGNGTPVHELKWQGTRIVATAVAAERHASLDFVGGGFCFLFFWQLLYSNR